MFLLHTDTKYLLYIIIFLTIIICYNLFSNICIIIGTTGTDVVAIEDAYASKIVNLSQSELLHYRPIKDQRLLS